MELKLNLDDKVEYNPTMYCNFILLLEIKYVSCKSACKTILIQ